MKIICLSGKARHGKDTVANLMKDILEDNGYKVLIASYAGLVKYVCQAFFGWGGEKDEYGRSLLQKVGTDVVRAQDPDYWVKFVADILNFFKNEWDIVLISDCRFPNECEVLKSQFDTHVVRITRPNFVSPLTQEQQNHPSETSLDDYDGFDSYITNPGTMDGLERVVQTWIKENLEHAN